MRYLIAWGHSGIQGQQWHTAQEASQYAYEIWGEIDAATPARAIDQVVSAGVEVGDWYVCGEVIHVIPQGEDEADDLEMFYLELSAEEIRDDVLGAWG